MTREEIINAYKARGWNDENAILADYNATGGSSISGSSTSNDLLFDTEATWTAAEAEALKELAPYYEKLLASYKGDIALAKQQMDTDYERGLRVKSETVATDIADIEKQKTERQRKFKIALNDLDQTMNARGLATSGIRTAETSKATTEEAYQKGLLDAQQTALGKGLEYYKEEAGATRNKQLEKWGMKPVSAANEPTGQYAPSNVGLDTTGYDVGKYVSEPLQKEAELAKAKAEDVTTYATNKYNRAAANWESNIKRLVQA